MGIDRMRVGIVGLGNMGTRHGKILAHRGDVDLCCGMDTDSAAVARFVDRFGCRGVDTLEEMLSNKLDAVVVSLPDNAHCEAVCACLFAGCHVLVEKPLATNRQDGETMVEAARASSRILVPGFTLRYDPRYRAAREYVRGGYIGSVSLVHARRNCARGAVERYGRSTSLAWHLTSHDVDAVLDVTGCRVEEVTARARSEHFREQDQLDALGGVAVLTGGVPAILESAWVARSKFGDRAIDSRLEIVGTEGVVEVAGLDEGLRLSRGDGFEFPEVVRFSDDVTMGPSGALCSEVDAFLGACRRNESSDSELFDALHELAVIESLEISLKEGTTITI